MFRGNITMKGYLKNPKATEEAFAGGWFHSGDLAVMQPDGYVKIKDRSKDIIISGGENISSIEVEDVLYRHPAVLARRGGGAAGREVGRDAVRVRRAASRARARPPSELHRVLPRAAGALQGAEARSCSASCRRPRPARSRSSCCASARSMPGDTGPSSAIARQRTTVVFDLGGVLIDWDPRHLYRKLFPGDEAGMERFLAEICTSEWNLRQDAGRSWAEATALLKAEHPGQAAMIDAFHQRWPEMMAGEVAGTVRDTPRIEGGGDAALCADELVARDVPGSRWSGSSSCAGFRASSCPVRKNWSSRTRGSTACWWSVTGFGRRTSSISTTTPGNAAAATALGMHGIHFTGAAALRQELTALGLLQRSV